MKNKEDIVDAKEEQLALLLKQSLEELPSQVADAKQSLPTDVAIKEEDA
jgi:hypothetical protein